MNKLLTPLLALAVACTTLSAQAQKAAGDPAAGARQVAMCVGCHGIVGYQASFPEIYKVPMIAGQSASYIASALNAYKGGDRKHPTMRAIADTLTDQDIANIAAYYSQLGLKPGDAPPAQAAAPGAEVQALIARDKDNACTKCHGANFNTPNDASVPKLAGQHKDYLYMALKSYTSDTHAQWGRANAVMSAQAKRYKPNELKALASYISTLPGEVKTVPDSKIHQAH